MDLEEEISLYKGISIKHKFGLSNYIEKLNGLNILYLNSRSIRYNNLNDVELLLQSFKGLIQIIVINETWLDVNSYESCNIENYTSYHNYRTNKRGGGVSIFCHVSVNSNLIINEKFLDNSHFLMINLTELKINIATLYRTPDSNFNDFLVYFAEKISKIKNVIFIGDFNVNMLNRNSANANNFENLIESESFVILNSLSVEMSTRVTEHTSTTIDLAVTDLVKFEYSLIVDNIEFSDHRCLFLNVNMSIPAQGEIRKTKINYSKIKQDFTNSQQCNSIQSWEDLQQKLLFIVSSNTSIKSAKIVHSSYKQPWCNSQIRKVLNERKKIYDEHKKIPGNPYLKTKYLSLKFLVENQVEEARKNYYSDKFNNNISNPRHTWGVINEMIYNRKPKRSGSTKELKVDGVTYNQPNDLCNVFNNYFSNIGEELGKECLCEPLSSLETTTIEFSDRVDEFSPVTVEEISKIIKSLNSSSASGYDGLSVKIIKNSESDLAPILTTLINNSFRDGTFPDILKVAKVVPIFKSGNKTDPNNFRPVAVLSNLSKIVEIAVKNRLIEHLVKINFVNSNQFGFQKASSTMSACLNFVETVYKFMENRKKTGSIFIDVRKAFDSVNHKILLDKLEHIGFNKNALELLKSFLENRFQYVDINGEKSERRRTNTGVPQGSILGPFLFIIFVNDLFNLKTKGVIQLFADDATVTYGENSFADLEKFMTSDLLLIKKWMDANKLTVNFKKTEFLIYYLRNTNITEIFNEICLEEIKINRVLEYKYLGLIVNHNLNWIQHVDFIKQRVARFGGVFRKISKYLNVGIKKQLYFAFVHSYLVYLNPIWSCAPEYKLKEIQILQNKSIKSLHNLPRLTSSISLYNSSILPIVLLSKYELSLLIFKIKNKLIKFESNFQNNSEVHSYSTRIVNNFRAVFGRNNITKNSIYSKGANVFNELTDELKNETKVSLFKTRLKTLLFRNSTV